MDNYFNTRRWEWSIVTVQITTNTTDIENAPMIKVAITGTLIIKGIGIIITAIGVLGSNGTGTQKGILTYTDVGSIAAKVHI